jgi:hypothetical protein
MPLTPELKEKLLEKGITAVSDPSGQPIRIYVESEKDLLLLPSEITIAGVSRPVQGIVSGRFYALQDRTGKFRPAPGGVSIGHKSITAGTLGCIVKDKHTGRRVILSNNHVLANSNQASIGDEILQPGPYDGGSLEDTIARLTRFVEIKNPPDTNLIDAAIATPLSDADVSDEILEVGRPTGIVEAKEGMKVKKSGRTTGLTSSTIFDTSATVKVYGYPWDYSIFEDQIISAEAIMKGGDSGSIWLSDDNRIMGLGFAGSTTFSIANKIQHVFDLLDLELPVPVARAGVPMLLTLAAVPLVYTILKRGH